VSCILEFSGQLLPPHSAGLKGIGSFPGSSLYGIQSHVGKPEPGLGNSIFLIFVLVPTSLVSKRRLVFDCVRKRDCIYEEL